MLACTLWRFCDVRVHFATRGIFGSRRPGVAQRGSRDIDSDP